MAKFMHLWRVNHSAPWPTDPTKGMQWFEMMFATIDQGLKSGQILEVGWFPNSISGYVITSGDAKDQFMSAFADYPWITADIQEIVPYETGKELTRQVLKAKAE